MYNYGFTQMALARGTEAVETDCIVNVLKARRRGFASDGEAWAELKARLEGLKKAVTDVGKIHEEMWDKTRTGNEDAFVVLCGGLARSAAELAANAVLLAALAKIAEEEPPIPEDEPTETPEQEERAEEEPGEEEEEA